MFEPHPLDKSLRTSNPWHGGSKSFDASFLEGQDGLTNMENMHIRIAKDSVVHLLPTLPNGTEKGDIQVLINLSLNQKSHESNPKYY